MTENIMPLTAGGLAITKMPNDNGYHLAEPANVNSIGPWGHTVTLCGSVYGSPVNVVTPGQVANLPLYRARNEFHRCIRCDKAARGE